MTTPTAAPHPLRVLKSTLLTILQSPPPPPPPPSTTRTISNEADSTVASLVVDAHCTLGECVLYDDRTHRIVWTDIDGQRLHRLDLTTSGGTLETIPMPRMVGAFALTSKRSSSSDNVTQNRREEQDEDDDDVYLMAWEDGFQLFHVGTHTALSAYSHGVSVNPKGLPSRLNDGRCDRSGTVFVCGGFYGGQDPHTETMQVYACRLDVSDETRKTKTFTFTHVPILDEIQIANSTCFSPDGSSMYFCDSLTKTIRRYPYSHDNNRNNGLTSFQHTTNNMPRLEVDDAVDVWRWDPASAGFPDGSCVDAEGYIWNCLWRQGDGPGRVHRIDPFLGTIVFTVHMPDTTSQCTCCCFGGEKLDVLFITTASIDRDEEKEPHAGGLYAVKVPFRGLLEDRFQLP